MKKLWGLGLWVVLTIARSAAGQSPSADLAPALWIVRSGESSVYVFGRMAVRSDTQWLTRTIDDAFGASDSLWLENPRAAGNQGDELIGRVGFSEGYSVLRALDETNRARLLSVLERSGMPPDALEGRKAWLANLFLSQLLDRFSNVDAASFPDTVFRARAEVSGKNVSSEWQDLRELVEYSAGLPEIIQLQMLVKALDDSESYAARLAAWSRGDLQALSHFAAATASKYPDAHRAVNVQRNARWIPRIQSMLAGTDTTFVAIGVGHLVGPDNLLTQLTAAGLVVERVQ